MILIGFSYLIIGFMLALVEYASRPDPRVYNPFATILFWPIMIACLSIHMLHTHVERRYQERK